MKICAKCNIDKSIEMFAKASRSKDGLQAYCKPCKSESYKQWREKNLERDQARQKSWKGENKDHCAKWQRDWSALNKDKVSEIARRKYYKRKSACPDLLDKGAFEKLVLFYGRKCLKCETSLDLTIDHIVPLTKGGSNKFENLQILCRSCNSSKGNRSSIDYRPQYL